MQAVTKLSTEEKTLEWKTIDSNHSHKPSMRWGHSSCIVDHTLYIFGGFADSNYMNDLWAYKDQQWHEIITSGDIPNKRSNATLSYDPVNHQLLLFGGGGPNKQRFNTVSTLDLNSLNWLEIAPFQSDPSPWERTYHVAEFAYPYLVVFGGEGADDLSDLWTYDVRSLHWNEVKTSEPKPCARRFHSSCLVGHTLYVFGGCHQKYISLNDLYALNLSPLLSSGESSQLQWQKMTLNGPLTERWGHTMAYYHNKLFIFGGRFNHDLNDLVSINLATMAVQNIETSHAPNARRRHGGGMVGSSLVLFGGFDGSYYDDLFYINLYKPKQSGYSVPALTESQSPDSILSSEGDKFPIWTPFLGRHFKNEKTFKTFLQEIKGKYSIEELQIIFNTLYRGWGELPLSQFHQQYLINVPAQEEQTNSQLVHAFMEWPYLCLEEDKQYVELENRRFQEYLSTLEDHWQMNRVILLNNDHPFLCSDRLLALRSQYFHSLYSGNFKNDRTMAINLSCQPSTFQILLAYLHTNILVVPQGSLYRLLPQLSSLAEYFSLQHLSQLCEELLCSSVTSSNYSQLLCLSSQLNMEKLEQLCSLRQLHQLVLTSKGKIQEEWLEGKGKELYKEIKFDLIHCKFQSGPAKTLRKGKQNQNRQPNDNRRVRNKQ